MPVEEFGFSRQTGSALPGTPGFHVSRLSLYRAPTGDADRCSVVFRNPTSVFIGAQSHWDNAARAYVQCEGQGGECCRLFGPPRMRIGAVLFVYSRNRTRGWSPDSGGSVRPWLFSERTFNLLRELNGSHPFDEHDIRIRSTEERYHALEISPASRCLWRGGHGEDFDDLRVGIYADYDRALEFIRQVIGRRMSDPDVVDRRANAQYYARASATINDARQVLDSALLSPAPAQVALDRFIDDDRPRQKEEDPPRKRTGRYEMARRKIRMEDTPEET